MSITVPPSSTERDGRGVSAAPIALIPERSRPDGPVTTKRLRRTVARYTALAAAGTALAHAAGDRPLANLGTGLVAPGAGYLSAGRPGAFAATQPAFAASLGLWLGSGNVLAPLSVWAGTALASTRRGVRRPAARRAVPLATAGLLAGTWGLRERGFRRAVKRRDARNAYLRQLGATPGKPSAATGRKAALVLADERVTAGPELTADELAFTRFTLDRALQPVSEFHGFDKIEQFQTSSIRYQVATMGYALATLQYARTPAFHGYLSQAQRNLIAKWQERICWAYWAKESVWGHLRYNPDPVPRDNIMLSGWLGYQIAGYVSNTLDQRYSVPGSISFDHPSGKRFDYDFHSLNDALVRNFEGSEFTLFPCEPNWIYALCNGYAVQTLPIYDRLYGTDYCQRILPGFRNGFENEFLSVDGRTIGLRSKWTGLTVPAMTSILSDAAVIFQLSPVFPDLARGLWEIVRHEWVDVPNEGLVQIDLSGWDKLDVGNYRRVPATAYSAIGMAAKEMGDTDLAARLAVDVEATLEPVVEGGVKRYAKASVLSNAALLAGQVNNPGGFHDRVRLGLPQAWAEGPVLEEAAYPEVLVARAVTDGRALELVLRPGAGAGRRSLGIHRLRPGGCYAVTGGVQTEVVADHEGRASIQVDLDGRREVRLTPKA